MRAEPLSEIFNSRHGRELGDTQKREPQCTHKGAQVPHWAKITCMAMGSRRCLMLGESIEETRI